MPLQDYCKHNGDFVFMCLGVGDYSYGWACGHGCGYTMNFDVDIATINNRTERWREYGIAYKPPEKPAEKALPPLVSSKL